MSTEGDRRTLGASRIPFEALVEVGGALGPSFEAQAVNISEEGMQLRTAYLPEQGQPLTCRFDAGPGQSVLASGEVIWTEQAGKGGEFGIRFTDMDPESIDVLRRMCGVSQDAAAQPAAAGSKVRLHIDGLASPMRARVKGSINGDVTVGSDLGFLQVGKELDLEDAASGKKRPARIDRVDVAVDPTSHIPQLVVTLRYADEADTATAHDAPKIDPIPIDEEAPQPAMHAQSMKADDSDLESVEKASRDMKGAFARGVSAIGPAFAKIATRAKTTVALLAAKRAAGAIDDRDSPRRTTAPAPGGGLHTAGRRVIRGESIDSSEEATMEPKFKVTKRKVAIAGAVVVALTLGVIAMRKPHAQPAATADATTSMSAAVSPVLTATAHLPTLPKPLDPVSANIGSPPPMAGAPGAPMPTGPMAMGSAPEADSVGGANPKDKKKHGKVTPFGNGAVSHGNILHLKMDGAVDQIQGAQQPTGFTVKIPGRKSIEAAGPLAARDGRIAAVKVTNDPAGAELTFTFKDGVPNYQVRAKGDTLEIALAPAGKAHGDKDKQVAKKAGAGKHGPVAKKKDKSPDKH